MLRILWAGDSGRVAVVAAVAYGIYATHGAYLGGALGGLVYLPRGIVFMYVDSGKDNRWVKDETRKGRLMKCLI